MAADGASRQAVQRQAVQAALPWPSPGPPPNSNVRSRGCRWIRSAGRSAGSSSSGTPTTPKPEHTRVSPSVHQGHRLGGRNDLAHRKAPRLPQAPSVQPGRRRARPPCCAASNRVGPRPGKGPDCTLRPVRPAARGLPAVLNNRAQDHLTRLPLHVRHPAARPARPPVGRPQSPHHVAAVFGTMWASASTARERAMTRRSTASAKAG